LIIHAYTSAYRYTRTYDTIGATVFSEINEAIGLILTSIHGFEVLLLML